jgi:signal transduction histidine kinase
MLEFQLDTRKFIAALIAVAALCVGLLLAANRYIQIQVLQEVSQLLESQVRLRQNILQKTITDSQRHITFIPALPDLQTIVDYSAETSNRAVKVDQYLAAMGRMQALFKAYMESNPSIAQLRIISFANNGLELVRVHRINDQVDIVQSEALQEKGERDYLRAAQQLDAGHNYISDINLNQEFGEIAVPEWPTYRIATKIYTSEGEAFGIVIVNFLAQPLLDEVALNLNRDVDLYLLNTEGHYLTHPQADLAFAFERQPTPSWQDEYYLVASTHGLSLVRHRNQSQCLVFAKRQLSLSERDPDRLLQIILAMDENDVRDRSIPRLIFASLASMVLFGVTAFILVLFWRYSKSSVVALETKAIFEAIIEGSNDAKGVEKQLHKANEQLVAKNQEMERFIYTVSHDLKSPLITINSFARSVAGSEDNQLSEQSEHRLNRIIANVEHMDKLLSELLNLSRILKQDIVIETCDIKDCVQEAEEAIEEIVESKNGAIKVDIKSDPVRANRRLLVQCLHNLFTNAMYYSRDKEPPVVHVSCANKGNETWVSIQDNGIGIEKKHFEKIFRIFERLGIGTGSGVGLAIVKTAMEKHGGRIELTSERGQGSIFSLVFPNNASSSKPQT